MCGRDEKCKRNLDLSEIEWECVDWIRAAQGTVQWRTLVTR
jgi:hypothetical protein